jgi:hypothetical protein
VPIALLGSSLRRSGSIFIVFEVITFGYGREESVMSRLAPIYTIYGRLYTTFGLGGRHTGQAGQMACLLGALFQPIARVKDEGGSVGRCFIELRKIFVQLFSGETNAIGELRMRRFRIFVLHSIEMRDDRFHNRV